MKFALVCDEFHPDLGGIARYGYELALRYVNQGLDFVVVTHLHTGQPEEEEYAGIRIRRIEGLVLNRANRVVSPLALRRCIDYLARGGFDLVHGLTIYSPLAFAAVCFAQTKGLPSVFTCHSIIERRSQILLHRPFMPVIARADRMIAVSDATAAFCRRLAIADDRIVTVYNGVDTSTFRAGVDGTPLRERLDLDSQPVVVTAIRLAKRKAPDLLVDAFNEALKEIPNARLVIAGAGREEARLTRQIARLGIGDRVHLVGRLSKEGVAELMAAGDVFVLPSSLEAFGLAALEAAATGTPVVCSDAGGIPEIFQHGVSALLYAPGDKTALARSIVRVIQDNTLRDELGRKGAEAARQLTWDACAERTLTVYEEACHHNAARRLHR